MTDRIYALTVILDDHYRTDDVEEIIRAIKMIRGVMKVEEHVSSSESYAAQERARHELGMKMWQVLYPND